MLSRLSFSACTLVIFSLLIVISIPLAQVEKKEEVEDLLEKKLEEKEAIIWYLGHSGWAIKTKSRLLIVDYVETESQPAKPSLANGHINPSEIRNQHVFVFVTHADSDHYSQNIFDWEKSIKNIVYIFGWQAETGPNYVCLEARERKKIEDIDILTIRSTDAGVGFLIKVDGLVIFHAGDHAHWGGSMMEPFAQEIDYLAQCEKEFDIVFLAIAAGRENMWESITKGVFYVIETLQPQVMIPMHAGGNEQLYKEFAQEAEKKKFKTNVHYAKSKGDRFFYQNSKIK